MTPRATSSNRQWRSWALRTVANHADTRIINLDDAGINPDDHHRARAELREVTKMLDDMATEAGSH